MELRAKEQGQLLATNPGNALPGNAQGNTENSTQTARLITLDWDDNGSIAVATRDYNHYQNNSFLRTVDVRESTFLSTKTSAIAANQPQWRSMA